MSGGGIVQLYNTIPFDDHHDEEAVIVAMNNEVNNTRDSKEFVFRILSVGWRKVATVAKNYKLLMSGKLHLRRQ